MLAFLEGYLRVGVQFGHALITRIGQEFDGRAQRQAAVLEQGEVMGFAGTGLDTDNLLAGVVNHELSFLGMTSLLAGVEAALFF